MTQKNVYIPIRRLFESDLSHLDLFSGMCGFVLFIATAYSLGLSVGTSEVMPVSISIEMNI